MCPFKLDVTVDEYILFIIWNQGNIEHKGHPCLKKGEINFPTRFISAFDKESILNVKGSCVSKSAAHNIYCKTLGRMLSLHDIVYIHSLSRKALQISTCSCENIME